MKNNNNNSTQSVEHSANIPETSKKLQKKLSDFGKVQLKVQEALASNVRVPTKLLHELKDTINSLKPLAQIPFGQFPEFEDILEWIDWEEENGQKREKIPYSARIQKNHHHDIERRLKQGSNPILNNEVEDFDFSYKLMRHERGGIWWPIPPPPDKFLTELDIHDGEAYGKLVLDRIFSPKAIANLNPDFVTYDSYLGVTWLSQIYFGHSRLYGIFTSSFDIPSGLNTLVVRSELGAMVAKMATARYGLDRLTLIANHRLYVRLPIGPNDPWLGIRATQKNIFETYTARYSTPSICDIIMNAEGSGTVTVIESIGYDLSFTESCQSAIADGLASWWEPIRWGIQ